jgi:fermentation-respiration switch protein FrsA (DUF1100 family)
MANRAEADGPKAAVPSRRWRRPLAWLLGLVAVAYGGVLIVLMALENSLVYYPVPASEDWGARPDGVSDVDLISAEGTSIHAWWAPAAGARGAVLYCHGNAGNLSHRADSIAALNRVVGESVLIFDYPGYGQSGGRPSEAGCYAAADAAYDWLVERQKIAPEHIVLYGGSLGGGVAVDLASRRPHRALVLMKTFTALPDVARTQFPWLPVRWLMRNRFDNLAKIGRCHRPVFIAHGTADSVVPFELGCRLFAAANEPKEFLRIEGGDHNEPAPDFYVALRRFLDKVDPASAAANY